MRTLLAAAVALAGLGCATVRPVALSSHPVEPVAAVDVQRYLGIWYEIAAIPQPFQRSCLDPSDEYSLRNDGQIAIVRRCQKNGAQQVGEGIARIVDRNTNAKLEVSFNGPFWDEYWIIDLDPSYNYAVVGDPKHGKLTVLSREPRLPSGTWAAILTRAIAQGYDISQVKRAER